MKILFLSAANSIHTVRWVNALAEWGHEVTLVSKADHHEESENVVSKQVKIIYLPVTGMKGYYLNAVALRKIYRKNGFNVINVHYASGYGTLARIARLPHILLSVWGSDVYTFPYESRGKEYILRKNLEYADTIASTSAGMAEQTGKFLKTERDIEITPFGVDIQRFTPVQRKTDEKNIVFGIVKSLSKNYGISMLINAFAMFLERVPEGLQKTVSLQIYGKGDQLEELVQLVKKRGLEEHVIFGGYISNSEVPNALHKTDIFVLGSERESFGVSAVEAMACGLPVIATDVSGFREVIEDNVTGFIVPVNDAKAMAEKMLELYYDKTLRERMGRRGRQRVEKLYSWDACVKKMVQIYTNL